jgi:hypothetical protein
LVILIVERYEKKIECVVIDWQTVFYLKLSTLVYEYSQLVTYFEKIERENRYENLIKKI